MFMYATDILSKGINPGVKPKGDAPWLGALQGLGGQILFTLAIVLVIIIAIGAVMWVGGKLSHTSGMQSSGGAVILWGVIGAVVLGSVSGLVMWATSINLF